MCVTPNLISNFIRMGPFVFTHAPPRSQRCKSTAVRLQLAPCVPLLSAHGTLRDCVLLLDDRAQAHVIPAPYSIYVIYLYVHIDICIQILHMNIAYVSYVHVEFRRISR